MFPLDTIQSRLPDPEWLEQWLDKQIKFDVTWETKVVDRILHNLSLLLGREFAAVQDLNKYRKEIGRELVAQQVQQAATGLAVATASMAFPAAMAVA
jgi:hypothetical protein